MLMVLMRSDRSNRVYLLLLLAVVCAYGRFYRFSYNNNKNNDDDDERLMLNGRTINNNNYYNYDDIKHLPMNKTITIRRRHNINYHNDMESFLHDCSTIRAYPSHDLINVRYRICKKWIHGDIYRYNVIPAYDMSDLVTNYTYHRAYNKVTKVKPFAAHLLLLGTCKQYVEKSVLVDDDDGIIRVKKKDIAMIFDQPVVNLVTLWTDNYFNLLVSYLPKILSLIKLLKNNPDIIIIKNLHRKFTRSESFIDPIIKYYGIIPRKLNVIHIEYGRIYIAHTMITPIANCKYISYQYIKMIRKAIHNIYKLNNNSSNNNNATTILNNIIIDDRRGSKVRYLSQSYDIYEELHQLYSKSYSIITYSPYNLKHTVEIFHHCKLFIASHGSSLTNILFMNPGSIVIEIRPQSLLNAWYYSYIAQLIGVKYYSILSKDSKATLFSNVINIDMNILFEMIKENLN